METLDDDFCQGVSFAVTNQDALAQAISLILVQEYSLARSLAIDADVVISRTPMEQSEIDDIITRRLKPRDVHHRDGFLFQLMMWLAAQLDVQPGDLVSIPHSQPSAKGQDSLLVHRDTHAVVALTICEDKATENPRDTLRKDVWPEIGAYEAGGRRDELRSNVIATLGTGGVPVDEAKALIRGIYWHQRYRYRVRVTIEGKRPAKLFDGFDKIVSGAKERRRGETTLLPSMRSWMAALAASVEAKLRTMVAGA